MYSWPISSYRTINSLFPSECLADRNVTQVGLLSAVKLTFFFLIFLVTVFYSYAQVQTFPDLVSVRNFP